MQAYVALLRGINVGGNKKVPMAELRELFSQLGFVDVSTYINSGNVLFSTKKTSTETLAGKIEKAIEKKFGFDVAVLVREKANILMLAKKIPEDWENNTKQKTDVFFLFGKYDSKTSLEKIETTPKIDSLLYLPGAIVWNINRSKYNKSGMHNIIGTELYKNMTARNINTVRKLAELLA